MLELQQILAQAEAIIKDSNKNIEGYIEAIKFIRSLPLKDVRNREILKEVLRLYKETISANKNKNREKMQVDLPFEELKFKDGFVEFPHFGLGEYKCNSKKEYEKARDVIKNRIGNVLQVHFTFKIDRINDLKEALNDIFILPVDNTASGQIVKTHKPTRVEFTSSQNFDKWLDSNISEEQVKARCKFISCVVFTQEDVEKYKIIANEERDDKGKKTGFSFLFIGNVGRFETAVIWESTRGNNASHIFKYHRDRHDFVIKKIEDYVVGPANGKRLDLYDDKVSEIAANVDWRPIRHDKRNNDEKWRSDLCCFWDRPINQRITNFK